MPLEFAAEVVLSLIDLIRMSLMVAIPAFFVVLAGQKLHKKLGEKFGFNWIVSAFVTAFAILLPIVFVLYLILFPGVVVEEALPEFMQPTFLDYAMVFVLTVVKNLLSVLLFALLLMPLIFFASFVDEVLKERLKQFKIPVPANTFLVVFITTFLAWVIVLSFDWILPALVWKLYWSPI